MGIDAGLYLVNSKKSYFIGRLYQIQEWIYGKLNDTDFDRCESIEEKLFNDGITASELIFLCLCGQQSHMVNREPESQNLNRIIEIAEQYPDDTFFVRNDCTDVWPDGYEEID